MSIEVTLKIRRYSSGEELTAIENRFTRRDFDVIYHATIDLTAATSTELKHHLSTIEFAFVKVTGTATDITFYKNRSPEGVEFSDTLLVWDLEGVTVISLMADAATTVEVYLGGT